MAKRRLNKNLVVLLTLSAFAMMILLAVLMLGQLQKRDPKYFVALAEQSAEQQQWQQAAMFYHEAWDRSGDAEFLVEVGEMWLRGGDIGKAVTWWRQALVHQPDLLAAHERQVTLLLQLARLYGTLQRWEQLRDAAEAMLRVESGQTPKRQAFAHHANGLALLNLESRDTANSELGIRELHQATTIAPEVVEYPIDLARQLARQEKLDEAEGLFQQLIERYTSPGAESSKAQLAFAQYLTSRQRLDDAAAHYELSLKLGEDDPSALREAQLGYAEFLTQRWARAQRDVTMSSAAQGFLEDAEAVLKRCIDADPDAFDSYLQLAVLYKSAGRHEDVVELCDKRIRGGFSRQGAEATQNKLNMFSLMIYASEACVSLGTSEALDDAAREKWLARADQYVEDAKGESPAHPRILSQAGRVKLARGQDRLALQDFRAADEAYGAFDTVNWENKIILAQTHLRLNEPGAAKEVLEGVLEAAAKWRGGDTLFWNLYALALLQNNDLDRAMVVVNRALLLDPANVDAKQLKAAILERQGKLADAGRLNQELTGSPAVGSLLAAREALLNGDGEHALEVLRKGLETDPADVRLVGATVHELVNRQRYDEAREIVERARKDKPDDRQLAQLAVLARGDLTDEQRDQAMLELNQSTEDAFEKALFLVAFYSRKEDARQTLHWLREAQRHVIDEDTPLARNATATQHRALLKAMIRSAAQVNDTAAMESARDSAVKYNVDGAGGKSILGWYHLQRREYELALRALQQAVQLQPTDAASFTHLGQCFQLLGRTDEAQGAFEQAVRLNPNDGAAHYGLAFLALSVGDKETHQRELSICERLIPNEPWVQEQVLVRREESDPSGAVREREALLKERPQDARNLQRLAALYETLGDRPKAEEAFGKLLESNPEDEKSIQAAAAHYRRAGRPERALELVKNYAQSRSSADQRAIAQYIVANEYLQQSNTVETENTLLAAEETAETVEIARALSRFYMLAVNQPKKAVDWCAKATERARRMKSPSFPIVLEEEIAFLLHRDINDIERASEDVKELRLGFPDYDRGLLWESEIHARTGDIERSIAALSDYLAKRPNDPNALYQRARHLLARGRVAAAIEDLTILKRTKPLALELQPRLLLARLHFRSGRKSQWLEELESLVKDAPDSTTAVEELARAYLQEKRLDDADRIVTAQMNRTSTSTDGRWFLLRGRISLDLGDGNKALADFRRAAEINDFTPESVTNALTAYLRLGRFAEGVEYYERYGGEKPTGMLKARYAQLLAKAGNKTKAAEQFRQAMALAVADKFESVREVADVVLATFSADEAVTVFAAASTSTDGSTDPNVLKPKGPLDRANERILIRAYTAANQHDDAAARLDALIATATGPREQADLWHELGDVRQLTGQTNRAVQAYETASKYDENNWIAQNNIAYLLSDKRGDNKAALPHAQRAVALNDNAFTLDTLGWIYVGLGKYDLAVAELSRAIRLNPDHGLTYYHLGEAYRRSNQFTEALDILKDGRVIADNSNDTSLIGLIETALENSNRRDPAP